MRLMFLGFFFVYLNFAVSYDGHYISLIPSWVGCLMLYVAANRLRERSPQFESARMLCLGLAIYTFTSWFVDILRGNGALGLAGWIMGFLSILLILYVTRSFLRGLADLEQSLEADLDAAGLLRIWKWLAAADVVAYILSLIPLFNLVGLLLAAVAGLLFLFRLWRSVRTGTALGL